MNIDFETYLIPIITVGCMCVGFVMKKWLPTDDKWIPTALLILGAISGAILFGFQYEGIVKGMLSGLASVGLHQVFKQHMKLDEQKTFNTDSFEEMVDYEDTNDLSEE